MSSHDYKADMKAAFTGLVVGAIALLIINFTIVKLTNQKFASHSTPAATP